MIVFVNHSKLISDSDVSSVAVGCAQQLESDFAPNYRRRSTGIVPMSTQELSAYAEAGHRPSVLSFFDDGDQAGALGWHTRSPHGLIYARVFVRPILEANGTTIEGDVSVSVTASHEVLEMRLDPSCNLWIKGLASEFWAYEPCDPVEASSYRCAGVSVSNFVCPSWWDAAEKAGAQFDFLGHLSAPFSLEEGGYAVKQSEGVAKEVYGAAFPEWKKGAKLHPASRTARRLAA